ncbi:MBL fold metallo-hydrolase [Spirochaetia bacterium]|nr:MBL fold metallo-hydrolase [Spirochaetia bacterium]
MFSVSFWGTRGSIPCPGRSTVIFGGNTACIEIRAGEQLVIVDMGTGIKPLGDRLMSPEQRKKGPINADIFISHTHMDHIVGFAMFGPLFDPATKLRIRGPVSFENDTLEAVLGAQLSYRYWPVRLDEFFAQIEYDQLRETTLDLGGGLSVTTKYLNHPILCLGYRFEYQGKSIVTAFDHEPFYNLFPTDPAQPGYDADIAREGELAARKENEKILKFYQDADILVHDTQYTDPEYETRLGWGHSSYEYAIESGMRTHVKKLILYHHDPNRTDQQLEDLETGYRGSFKDKTSMEIIMAREGMILEA